MKRLKLVHDPRAMSMACKLFYGSWMGIRKWQLDFRNFRNFFDGL